MQLFHLKRAILLALVQSSSTYAVDVSAKLRGGSNPHIHILAQVEEDSCADLLSENPHACVNRTIFCPFLNNYRPSTASLHEFVSDLEEKGQLNLELGTIGWALLVEGQHGPVHLLEGYAPNLYELDRSPPLSHKGLFQHHFDKFERMADADGYLMAQNLVEIKIEIANEDANSEINKASQIETALLFLGSGGNLDTGKVSLEDVKTFLSGTAVRGQGPINFDTSKKALALQSWSECTESNKVLDCSNANNAMMQ
jgi:hypothetical protein